MIDAILEAAFIGLVAGTFGAVLLSLGCEIGSCSSWAPQLWMAAAIAMGAGALVSLWLIMRRTERPEYAEGAH